LVGLILIIGAFLFLVIGSAITHGLSL